MRGGGIGGACVTSSYKLPMNVKIHSVIGIKNAVMVTALCHFLLNDSKIIQRL